ncbi:hypothetical protein GDO78_002322 [Eleutherodactylus coqui]|uniref:G-protein coupled receptors family 1 profile domain-containing protein n=1 Tax=Eleutherodactylus coqui TaxID=57060 RepID=A0A8J6EY88_ELECQ|nr:hypothetical protein GDO78_002322 [Eleutherodactylus coqui]
MEREIHENLCYLYWDKHNSSDLQDLSPNTTHPSAIQYSSFVLSIITCIIGLPANIIVIFVTGFLMKKNKYKIWFLNLALADFTLLLFLPFQAVLAIRGSWPYGPTMCKLYHLVTFINMYCSISILTALNIVRALSVAKPVWHRRFHSQKFCWCTCVVIWVLVAICGTSALFSDVYKENPCSLSFYDSTNLVNIPSFISEKSKPLFLLPWEIGRNVSGSDPEFGKDWRNMVITKQLRAVSRVMFGYIIPLCVILLSNIIIAHHVKNSKMPTSPRLYTLITVTVMSFFCTKTPFVLTGIIFLVSLPTIKFTLMYKLSIVLPLLFSIAATNSLLNPLVYVLVGKEVRSEIVTFFRKKYAQEKRDERGREKRATSGFNSTLM